MSSPRIVGVSGFLCVILFISTWAWSQISNSNSNAQSNATDEQVNVVMRTSMGDITIELDAARAPQTVENFLAYVDNNFYADTVFHRVIDGFMIQGGGYDQQLQRKSTRAPISNEAYNGLRNKRYTIAMARTTAPHSATSQFFINTANNTNLDHTDTSQRGWGYTVFGRVTAGQEVVDAISSVRTNAAGPFSQDVPTDTVIILGVDRQPAAALEAPENTNGSNTIKQLDYDERKSASKNASKVLSNSSASDFTVSTYFFRPINAPLVLS